MKMAKMDASKLTKEQIQKAMACESAEELMKLAKSEGYDITKDEAEAYLAELSVRDIGEGEMRAVAGGYLGAEYYRTLI